jgi:hypothetical protein
MTMPDQPTPQPSGRTAQEILDKSLCNSCRELGMDRYARRRLFDALVEIVGPDLPNLNGAPTIVTWNRSLAELRQRLRVFFNQAAPPQPEKGMQG